MSLAPIALFVYNRPLHTQMTLEALQKNKSALQSDLFIFSDGSKNEASTRKVEEVRNYIKKISGFKSVTIVERKYNIGLASNIIDGVSQIVNDFGKIIVLEDDLLTSPYFLDFMNEGLRIYEEDKNVVSIHGYSYPVKENLPDTFFIRGADCWGWATWKRGWSVFEPDGKLLLKKLTETDQLESFDFNGASRYVQMLKDQTEGKVNSWAIRWYASAFINNMYTLYPGKSLISNTGGDGTGTNTGFADVDAVPLSPDPVYITRIEVHQNIQAYEAFAGFHRKASNRTIWFKIRRTFKKIFKPAF